MDVGNSGGYTWVGTGGIREISVPAPQFCYEPNCSRKTKSLIKKERKKSSE